MFDTTSFAKRLHNLRVARKLNQSQLADEVGVSRFAIGKMELGQRAASIEVLYALADFFDVSIDYLVGRSDNPSRL